MESPGWTAAEEDAALDREVGGRALNARIDGLYAKLPLAVLSNLPVVAGVAWVLRGANRDGLLLSWVGATAALTVFRLVQRRSYHRTAGGGKRSHLAWARYSVGGSFLSGLIWAGGILAFLPAAGLAERLFVFAVLAGLVAGSAGALSDFLPAFLAFVLPCGAAAVGIMGLSTHPLERLLAAFGAVYQVVISLVAWSSGRRLDAALRLRYRNEVLLDRVSQAQLRLEALNDELEARVLQRGEQLARVERQLSQAALLASVGQLSASLAHELNGPLASIGSNLGFVEGALADPPRNAPSEGLEALTDARAAAAHMRDIVRNLTAVARADGGSDTIDLRSVLESCVAVASAELRSRAGIVRQLVPAPRVRGDVPGLAQVFLQLLLTVGRAIPEGVPAAHTLRLRMEVDPGGTQVRVEVSGTGTRGQARGDDSRGGDELGLALSREVVARLGGTLVEGAPEAAGTSYTVTLPVVRA